MAHLSENTAGILDVKSEPGTYLLYGGTEVYRLTMETAASSLVAGKKVFWVDGDNSFNPYILSTAAKRTGINPVTMLSLLFIARAFTAHQLGAMVVRYLAPALARDPDALGIIYNPLSLCLDPDVSSHDARRVLQQITKVMKESQIQRCRLIVVCPDIERRTASKEGHVKAKEHLFNMLHAVCNRKLPD